MKEYILTINSADWNLISQYQKMYGRHFEKTNVFDVGKKVQALQIRSKLQQSHLCETWISLTCLYLYCTGKKLCSVKILTKKVGQKSSLYGNFVYTPSPN